MDWTVVAFTSPPSSRKHLLFSSHWHNYRDSDVVLQRLDCLTSNFLLNNRVFNRNLQNLVSLCIYLLRMHEIENPIEPDLKFEIHSKGLVIRYTWALILLQVPNLLPFLSFDSCALLLVVHFWRKMFQNREILLRILPGSPCIQLFTCQIVRLW